MMVTNQERARFWSHVVVDENGCFVWNACRGKNGYGMTSLRNTRNYTRKWKAKKRLQKEMTC